MNKVYIVLVNYNNWADTIECLESLLKSSYSDFQIFVIDNSPNEASIKNISAWADGYQLATTTVNFKHLVYPLVQKPLNYKVINANELADLTQVLTVVKTINNGFAAANNVALNYILRTAPADALIWILNNDTVVEKNTLDKLVLSHQKNTGSKYIYGCTMRYYDNPTTIQAIAGSYNIWLGKHYHIGDGEIDNGQYINYKPTKKDYIIGASIFLPKLFLQEAGLMSEEYFLYFEELDWINKGRKYGFSVALVPNAIVYHKEGASIIGDKQQNKNTSVAEYYSIVSRVRFIKKWYPVNLITVMFGVLAALIKRAIQGKFSLVKKTTIAVFKILLSRRNRF